MTDHPRSCGANAMTGYSNRVTIGSSPLVRGQPIHVNKRLVLLDHPRSCGANDSLYHRLDFAHGSSPLVRGQRRGRTLAVHGERIIPARAGPTCIAGQVPWCSTDHPRSCGANPTIYLVSFFCSGSSPLVRGQRVDTCASYVSRRIIPARAGPTINIIITSHFHSGSSPLVRGQLRVYYRNLYCYPDHPRSCGANIECRQDIAEAYGSSPLVRGQPLREIPLISHLRIIPARAGPTRWWIPPTSFRADHPRSCGANALITICTCSESGSSPLVRGQHCGPARIGWLGRIIPARAGPTCLIQLSRTSAPDHPRSCGANAPLSLSYSNERGSSPLVRGQRPIPSSPTRTRRIIAARAGPTPSITPQKGDVADHPRSCGANRVRLTLAEIVNGSSPLVRGQLAYIIVICTAVRIIPARAGPTKWCYIILHKFPDHPRSCGANAVACACEVLPDGSSPLVRGQPWRHSHTCQWRRIIPARAGPTNKIQYQRYCNSDHPRSCGANQWYRRCGVSQDGSSPLVRGQLDDLLCLIVGNRIIPARAGPTDPPARDEGEFADHPRSCGANMRFPLSRTSRSGSSPLVRGQQWFDEFGREIIRIIPARAGPTRRGLRPYCR